MSETSAVSAPQDARSRALAGARSAYASLLQRLGVTPELARYALLVFALSRAGFIVVTLLATRFLHAFRPGTGTFIGAWVRYDAISYARLAVNGYTLAEFERAAFFPLDSWLIHLLALPFGGGYIAAYAAAIVVSNVCYLIALFGLAALALHDADASTARRVLLYLTLFPTALFLFAGYAESLFLALAIWCVVALRHRAWLLAGFLGLLASLTRQMGLFLVLPFIWEYGSSIGWWGPRGHRDPPAIRHGLRGRRGPRRAKRLLGLRRVRWDALAILLMPTGLLIFMAWLWRTLGDPLAFVHAERHWDHHFELPWQTLVTAVQRLPGLRDPIFRFAGSVDLFAIVLVAALIVIGARRLPLGDTAYAAAIWLLAVCYPTTNWPLQSDARYMLLAFPALLLLARLGSRPWLNTLVLVVFGFLLLLMTQYFVRGGLII